LRCAINKLHSEYKEVGWDCLVIWDKELETDAQAVEGKLKAFVGGNAS